MTQTDFNPASSGSVFLANGGYPASFTATVGTAIASEEVRTDLASQYLWRVFFTFDTSSIPDNASVSAVALRIYRDDTVDGPSTNTDSTRVEVVPQTQASNTALVDEDYDQITRTSKGNRNFADFPDDTYSEITIADLSVVNKSGYTKLALITGRDFDQATPTGGNLMAFQGEGAANPPILRVTYDIKVGSMLHMIQ